MEASVNIMTYMQKVWINGCVRKHDDRYAESMHKVWMNESARELDDRYALSMVYMLLYLSSLDKICFFADDNVVANDHIII
jgi:hypothetical protein